MHVGCDAHVKFGCKLDWFRTWDSHVIHNIDSISQRNTQLAAEVSDKSIEVNKNAEAIEELSTNFS